ncbi:hypothetical protein [Pontiella sulfatireligans]|uniref:hypothetical protein n=1 Tax=Pontiella sulfatireligans TaxID=2750658 RepID=UPI00109C3E35|nr:hypothetical protein [Pontiella sulfatireligans]
MENLKISLFGKRDEILNVKEPTIEKPNHYSFEYLKQQAMLEYGQECGVLTIQYGSSRTNEKSINDIDYLVLVHGNYYTNESKAEVDGVKQ